MNVTLLDGAIGTLLMELSFTPPFEELNLTHPEVITKIHQDYLKAGSEILLTHTFSAHTLAQCVSAWNNIKDLSCQKFISIGPQANTSLVVDYFKDKARLVFETIYQLEAAKELINNYHSLNPIFSFCMKESELTEVIYLLQEKKITIVGLNCLNGLQEVHTLLRLIPQDFEIYLKLNTGSEKLSPVDFAREVFKLASQFNITYLGGCCGTTPAYIQELQKVRGTF